MNLTWLYRIALIAVFLGVIVFIVDFGFPQSELSQSILNNYYFIVLGISAVATVCRYVEKRNPIKRHVIVFDILTVLFTLFIFYLHLFKEQNLFHLGFYSPVWVKLAIFFAFIREFSVLKINYKHTVINPGQLFIASFLFVILIGTLLLMLPKATYSGISFIDALFTSTSAVCITGLTVVDTGICFTKFGHTIIMLLMQFGGLGILTFASYFGYFFRGGTTYDNRLALMDMTNSQKISKVFSTLKYIIVITFGIEIGAGAMIYFSVDANYFHSHYDRLLFSAFHAVTAFCNAGFSTIPNGLYQETFRFNYLFQMIIIVTFVVGGLGFPIIVNILNYIKYKFSTSILFKRRKTGRRPWVLNIDSKITLITTSCLTGIAFILFFAIEYGNTLSEHSGTGKIVTALFEATTPRSAGFNTVDMAHLALPSIMIVIILMWIGASPASTGGGIKTSTFAIAVLNILSLAKGKTRIEIFRREIAGISMRRAFAIITLSLIMTCLGIILVSAFDSEKDLKSIAFECFSAYSTCGLSLGITGDLSSESKLVIMTMMFVGRVSMLTILIAVFKKAKYKNYIYPTEEIMIN
ncbi:MAG: ATPase [Prevotellaceae bacterium]|jgi:Trk-type K+ transport system membrane component|nr:ATPase [Prevotellaceae bacterium]